MRLDTLTTDPKLLQNLKEKREKWNKLPTVEYQEIFDFKVSILRDLYKVSKGAFMDTPEFNQFFEENESWLPAYALYSVFREDEASSDWMKWNPKRKSLSLVFFMEISFYFSFQEKVIELSRIDYKERCGFYFYVQFHLHLQLKEASE